MNNHKIEQSEALDFILAGKSTFTIKSLKTGKHFTYKASVVEKFGKRYVVVMYLSGSDNIRNFSYLCRIDVEDSVPLITRSKKLTDQTPSFFAFNFVFLNLLCKRYMTQLEIWHEGICGRCGRKLTVPESIKSGYGPECIGKVKLFTI